MRVADVMAIDQRILDVLKVAGDAEAYQRAACLFAALHMEAGARLKRAKVYDEARVMEDLAPGFN